MAKLSVFAPGAGNLWDDSGYYGKVPVSLGVDGALSNNISVNTNFDSVGAWRRKNPFNSWYGGLTGDNIETQLDIGYFGNISTNPQQVQNSTYSKIITNKNAVPFSSLDGIFLNGRDWLYSLSAWQPRSFEIHKAIYAGNDVINASGVEPLPDGLGNRLAGYDGDDWLTGSKGNDILYGMVGNDLILAGEGDDIIVGGSGNDFINGDAGADNIRGGLGWNIIKTGVDSVGDTVYVSADGVTNKNINSGGIFADIVSDINEKDQLFISGVEDSTLTFVDNVSHPRAGQFNLSSPLYNPASTSDSYSGVGIYSNGILEAIVTTVGATSSSVDQFTTGIL